MPRGLVAAAGLCNTARMRFRIRFILGCVMGAVLAAAGLRADTADDVARIHTEAIGGKVLIGVADERLADSLTNLWRLRIDKSGIARHASHRARPQRLGRG